MSKAEFLQMWHENTDGRHNETLFKELARVFAPDDAAKPYIKFYDFVVTDANKGGRLVARKYLA